LPRLEVEVLAGLADLAGAEVERLGGNVVSEADTALRVDWAGDLRTLRSLRLAVAVYLVERFDVPRPKALLGDQALRQLTKLILQAQAVGGHRSLRLRAAGRDTAVMQRLASAVSDATGLALDQDEGELVVRVVPGAEGRAQGSAGGGWEALARLSPRPLSARRWRAANLPGALNATIAAAMVELAGVEVQHRVLNLMCGSGTLLIEAGGGVGVDIDPDALALARRNDAGLALVRADARAMPFADASFDRLLADLPYGHRMGSHRENEALYPAVLDEAARVARPGARLAVITHELRRLDSALAASGAWRVEHERRVFQKGHHPHIWVLAL
jgi:tRNA (guanine6-N2)-methyltransferase